ADYVVNRGLGETAKQRPRPASHRERSGGNKTTIFLLICINQYWASGEDFRSAGSSLGENAGSNLRGNQQSAVRNAVQTGQ
ncbi:MAG: hypothetical protein O2873_13620, partial [Proteobacteria bacterium]|nr:hypothetical protein [Pseudomonadota bacterium]